MPEGAQTMAKSGQTLPKFVLAFTSHTYTVLVIELGDLDFEFDYV